jgi:hypothetical protein
LQSITIKNHSRTSSRTSSRIHSVSSNAMGSYSSFLLYLYFDQATRGYFTSLCKIYRVIGVKLGDVNNKGIEGTSLLNQAQDA